MSWCIASKMAKESISLGSRLASRFSARQCGTRKRRVDHCIDPNCGGYGAPPFEKMFQNPFHHAIASRNRITICKRKHYGLKINGE